MCSVPQELFLARVPGASGGKKEILTVHVYQHEVHKSGARRCSCLACHIENVANILQAPGRRTSMSK
jgi:hypothetical protein